MQTAVDQMPIAQDFKGYFMEAIAVPANRSMTMSAADETPTPH